MATSLLFDAPFTHTVLSYKVQSDTPTGHDPVTGNPIFGTTTKDVKALVAPFKSTQLQRAPGADPKMLLMKGELLEPLTFPDGKGIGSSFDMTYSGKAGKLMVTNVIENDLLVADFGAYLEGSWLPNG